MPLWLTNGKKNMYDERHTLRKFEKLININHHPKFHMHLQSHF